jgi:uncharacterized protein (TIGR00299 family) protein
MHIHLTPTGGIAGDMFVAAMLDTWPDLAPGLDGALQGVLATATMPAGVEFRLVPRASSERPGKDVIAGARFHVSLDKHEASANHHHRSLADIRTWLETMGLELPVRERALHIFELLAAAEGHVHGVAPELVTFHEVGAWDSVVDIVAAAWLIEAVAADSWSVASLPLGSGTVQTAHGLLPLPAPATARLMRGFTSHDDGRPGERVTPTGMAILCHLQPQSTSPLGPGWNLERTGFGLGTRKLDGIPNVLGAISFSKCEQPEWQSDEVAVIEFDIDDQSPEDLAIGLDRMRTSAGVIDVTQTVAYGKKNRLVAAIRVLAKSAELDSVLKTCFLETTTIGARYRFERRATLVRELRPASASEGTLGQKTVTRPGGIATTKVEAEDLRDLEGGWVERERKRRELS